MKSTLKATVTTAVELTKKQVSSIVKAVEKKHKVNSAGREGALGYKGRTVELKQVVNPSVIAGVKLTVGAEEMDATTYTKLEKLHLQLKENI